MPCPVCLPVRACLAHLPSWPVAVTPTSQRMPGRPPQPGAPTHGRGRGRPTAALSNAGTHEDLPLGWLYHCCRLQASWTHCYR